jgi:hypothetical protein
MTFNIYNTLSIHILTLLHYLALHSIILFYWLVTESSTLYSISSEGVDKKKRGLGGLWSKVLLSISLSLTYHLFNLLKPDNLMKDLNDLTKGNKKGSGMR